MWLNIATAAFGIPIFYQVPKSFKGTTGKFIGAIAFVTEFALVQIGQGVAARQYVHSFAAWELKKEVRFT